MSAPSSTRQRTASCLSGAKEAGRLRPFMLVKQPRLAVDAGYRSWRRRLGVHSPRENEMFGGSDPARYSPLLHRGEDRRGLGGNHQRVTTAESHGPVGWRSTEFSAGAFPKYVRLDRSVSCVEHGGCDRAISCLFSSTVPRVRSYRPRAGVAPGPSGLLPALSGKLPGLRPFAGGRCP